MRGTTTYRAIEGRVWAMTPAGKYPVSTACGTGGFHLQKFEKALFHARAQRRNYK